MLPHFITESFHAKQSGIIFLGCYYYLVVSFHLGIHPVYALYIGGGKLMMVCKCEWFDVLCVWLKVHYHLLRRCYSGKEQHVGVFIYGRQFPVWSAVYGFQVSILQRSEEKLLIWIEIHGLCYNSELHRLKVLRAFRNDNDVCSRLSAFRFPQSSCRQQLVVHDEPVVVYEQYVYSRFYIPVLEGIVEKYYIGV